MNYRTVCKDVVITVAICWLFLYWAPNKLGEYFNKTPYYEEYTQEPYHDNLWYDDDFEFDIEEAEDISGYIDDYDVYDYTRK